MQRPKRRPGDSFSRRQRDKCRLVTLLSGVRLHTGEYSVALSADPRDCMAKRDLPFSSYIAALVLAMVVPLVILLAYFSYRDFKTSESQAQAGVLRSAQLSAARTAGFLRESEDILRGLSRHPPLRALDSRQCGSLLAEAKDLLKYHVNVVTRNAAGKLVCTAVPPKAGVGPPLVSTKYLLAMLRAGKFTVGGPLRSSITGTWVVPLQYPLRDAQGRIAGAVVLALDLAKFHEVASSVALIAGTATRIITGDGIVIASSHDGEILIGQDARHTDVVGRVLTTPDGTVRALGAGGAEHIYGVAAVPGTDWRVVAGTPAEAIFAQSRRALLNNALIMAAFAALAAMLSVFLGRKVVASVGNIARAAAAVAAGDRTVRADPSGPIEIKTVAAQFNNMLDVLDKAERRLSGIIASAMDAIITIDERDEITLVNPAGEQMFGYSEADLLGKPISMLIPERHHAAHAQHIENFARTKLTHRTMGRFGEIAGRRADGREFPVDGSISQMEWAGQRLYSVILRDITPRIEAERALRESEAQLRLAVDSGSVGLWEWDMAADEVTWNARVNAILGLPEDSERLMLEQVLAAVHRDDRAEVERACATALENRTEFDHVFRILRLNGEVRWIVSKGHGVYDSGGQPVRMIGAALDVTERKQTALELERKTVLAQLLESLTRAANEARTPEEAMKSCLARLCDFSDWALGRVGTCRQRPDRRFPDHSVWQAADPARYEEFMRASEHMENSRQSGSFMALVLREKRPVWISDINQAYGFGRREAALAHGLRAAFAFPVVVEGEVVAVLEFYADTPRAVDATLVTASEAIAAQLARLIERSRAEKLDAQLAAIVEHSNDAIISRGPDRAILTWNAAAERLFGYTAAEAIGRNVSLLIPADQEAQAAHGRALLENGLAVSVYDTVRLGKDGRRIDVSITASPVKDASGKMTGASLVFREIGERKRAEVEHAQLAAIVESSNDAILIRGPDRTILSWNAAAERLFGWSAQEAVGQCVDMIVPREHVGRLQPFIERAARGEHVSPIETTHLRKDGARIPTQITLSPVSDKHGNVFAHSFTVRDMTELRRKEETLRSYAARLRELSRRLREVEETERHAIARELHDRIGQELSTLTLWFGKLAARLTRESPSAVQKQLEDMQGLLKSMVEDVRDVMAELQPPVLADYGVHAALRQLATKFARQNGISVELIGVDLQPRLPSIVETAMFRISQEALNNIAKHARAKKIEISLSEDSERVVLDIADDGVGFDAARTRQDGRHWGMTIMRERAEAVGIAFRLESAPGAGARVVLEVERAAS